MIPFTNHGRGWCRGADGIMRFCLGATDLVRRSGLSSGFRWSERSCTWWYSRSVLHPCRSPWDSVRKEESFQRNNSYLRVEFFYFCSGFVNFLVYGNGLKGEGASKLANGYWFFGIRGRLIVICNEETG